MKLIICAYDTANYINGPNAWLLRLIPYLNQCNIQTRILFLHYHNIEDCSTIQKCSENRYDFRAASLVELKYTESRIRWLLNESRIFRPDVFIANLVTPAFYAAKWLQRYNIPVVCVLHSYDPFYKAVVKNFLNNSTYKFKDVVSISHTISLLLTSNENVVSHVIACGSPISTVSVKPPTTIFKIIYIGRIVQEQKRIIETTKVICHLAQKHKTVEANFYGTGSNEADVIQIINGHNLNQRVQLMGNIANDRIMAEILKHHVFVLLSDYEGMSIALNEAMGCGLVPVCYKYCSGIDEIIIHEHNGLLVENREEAFIEAIERLMFDNSLWEKLSQNARKTIVEKYSSEISNAKWLNLLNEINYQSKRKQKISIPLCIKLEARNPDLTDDIRRPPVKDILKVFLKQKWIQIRLIIRPRARLRKILSSLQK